MIPRGRDWMVAFGRDEIPAEFGMDSLREWDENLQGDPGEMRCAVTGSVLRGEDYAGRTWERHFQHDY